MTDEILFATIVALDELAKWASPISVLLMLAISEVMRRTFATKDDLETEREHRETADKHRDSEQHRVSELVQQYLGKTELLKERMEQVDRAREMEVQKLAEEMRLGFSEMKRMFLESSRNNNKE